MIRRLTPLVKVGTVLAFIVTTCVLYTVMIRYFGALPEVRRNTDAIRTIHQNQIRDMAQIDTLRAEVDSLKILAHIGLNDHIQLGAKH